MNFQFRTLDVLSGLEVAKDNVIDTVKGIVNNIAVPILSVVIVGVLLFFIVGAIQRHRHGEDNSEKVKGLVICIVILALVATFPAWGWQLIG